MLSPGKNSASQIELKINAKSGPMSKSAKILNLGRSKYTYAASDLQVKNTHF